MPIVVTGPYPSVEEVLQDARALVNDTYGGTGLVLTDTAPFTIPLINGAIRRLRLEFANNNISTVIKDNVILSPILPVQNIDPSVQQFISWSGFYDGTQMWPVPVLPPDLIVPLFAWERQTGAGLPFVEMQEPQSGLISRFQYPSLGQWEWRTDQINLIGSTESRDMRLRYEAQVITEIQPDSDFTVTTIGSIDSQDALAYEIAYRFATARGAAIAPQMKADRDEYLFLMVNRYVRRQQEIPYLRQQFGATNNPYPGGNINLP